MSNIRMDVLVATTPVKPPIVNKNINPSDHKHDELISRNCRQLKNYIQENQEMPTFQVSYQ